MKECNCICHKQTVLCPKDAGECGIWCTPNNNIEGWVYYKFPYISANKPQEAILTKESGTRVIGEMIDFEQELSKAEQRGAEKERERLQEKVHDVLWNEDGSLKTHDVSTIVSKTMHQFIQSNQ